MELLHDIDALYKESSWQIVLKKSGEGNDADKIKAIFTSTYFGAQTILGSLSLQTHSRSVHRNVQGTFIYIMSFNPMTDPRSGKISIFR